MTALRRHRRYAHALTLVAMAFAFPGCPAGRRPAADSPLPRTMLWAWEQPTRLGFLDPRTTGVAYLAATVRLRGDDAATVPRLQPLEVPPATQLFAVVRVELDRRDRPALSEGQRARLVGEVASLQDLPQVRGVQLDFDAGGSAREFYRLLLGDLRRALRPGKMLSMTALASWCAGDPWLDDLPVDEAVPMLFRMGPDGGTVLTRLEAGQDFTSARCRQAYGVAVDEPASLPAFLAARRRYVFNGKAWTREAVDEALKGIDP